MGQAARLSAAADARAKGDPFAYAAGLEQRDIINCQLCEWLSHFDRRRWFGLKVENSLPPFDGEQSRIAHELATEKYYDGTIGKEHLAAVRAEIDRAVKSYFVRGRVAYIGNKHSKRREVVAALLERDGFDCWFCADHMPEHDRTVEHLLPRSRGGTDGLENLRLTHRECNFRLGDLPVAEKLALKAALSKEDYHG